MTIDELTKLLEDDQFKKKLFEYLKRCGFTGPDAQDAIQTALLVFVTSPKLLEVVRTPLSYIGVAASSKARDQRRRIWRETVLDEAPVPKVTPFRFKADVYLALDQLNEEDRWLIEQHYFEGLSYGELEKLTGISADTLHARVRRILRRMRECLESTVDSPADPNDLKGNASIPRKTAQSDVGKKTRKKSSTMSA